MSAANLQSVSRRAHQLECEIAVVDERLGNMQSIVHDIRAAVDENENGDFLNPQRDEDVCDIEPDYKKDLEKCTVEFHKFSAAFNALEESVDTLVEKWLPRKTVQQQRVTNMHARIKAVMKILVARESQDTVKRTAEQAPVETSEVAKRIKPDTE
jgi:hypothetical protein